MNKHDLRYLKMAKIWGEASYCERLKVGCLIVKGNQIISDGYNGTPSGFPNVCEVEGEDRTKPETMHAESNAIVKCARYGNSCEGATLYCQYTPCLECAKLIIQAGISRVVCSEQYRDLAGVELLKRAGVVVHTEEFLKKNENRFNNHNSSRKLLS